MDIGTEAVKAMAGERAVAVSYFDEFGVFDNHNFWLSVIKKAVMEALSKVQTITGRRFQNVILSLPPDGLKTRVAFHSLDRDGSKKSINGPEAKKISAEIIKGTQDKIARAYAAESGISPNHLDFLRSTVLQIKIDGYEVKDIQGCSGKNLEFRVLSVFMPKNYFQGFEALARELGFRIIQLAHPFENLPYAFKEASGIFVDVGGDITQFCLMDKGLPKMIGDYKIGGRNFSQALSHALGISEENGRNLKERYSDRDLTEDARGRVESLYAPALAEWTAALQEQLRESSQITNRIYVWGGGSRLFGLMESLSQKPFEVESMPSPQFFNLMLMNYAFQ